MSIKQMSIVWEHDFSPNEQLVMLALADHANDEGGSIYPSLARVAWKTGYSRRSVQRIISELRDKKILKIVEHANMYHPNEYRIQWKYAKKKPPYVRGRQNVTPADGERVDVGVYPGMTPVSTKPSVNHQLNTSSITEVIEPHDWGKNNHKHPAMLAYRTHARLHVEIALRPSVIEAVGTKQADVERWGKIVYEWIGKGWSKRNVLGMLEVYRKGWGKRKTEKEYSADRYVSGAYSEFVER